MNKFGKPLFSLGLVTLASACGDSVEIPPPQNVQVAVSGQVATLADVRWTTESPTIGYVEFGTTESLESNTPIESTPAQAHTQRLLGLTADTDYLFRVVTWNGEEAAISNVGQFRTGSLPAELPLVNKQGQGHEPFTVVPLLGVVTAAVIVDAEGTILWYALEERGREVHRAIWSNDRSSVLYDAVDPAVPAESDIVRVSFDGAQREMIPIAGLAGDFVEHADGTLAAIVREPREVNGTTVIGDQIVEVGATGEHTSVWSAFDCFDPSAMPGRDIATAWTLATALDYDETQGLYHVALQNLGSIVQIDRQTGECRWVLGATGATLTLADGATELVRPSQFDVRGDRVVVWDAGVDAARVIEYQLDLEANLATQVWTTGNEPAASERGMGDVTRLVGGDTLVNWGSAGRIERITEPGQVTWQLAVDGFTFGFHDVVNDLYD